VVYILSLASSFIKAAFLAAASIFFCALAAFAASLYAFFSSAESYLPAYFSA